MEFKYTKRSNSSLGLGNILETLLLSRGIKNPNEFLNVNESHVEDYNKFDNIMLAGHLYIDRIKRNSKIVILVD